MKKYTLTVEVDENDEYVLQFPAELLNDLKWKPGDTLRWKETGVASWTIEKVDADPLAEVDTNVGC